LSLHRAGTLIAFCSLQSRLIEKSLFPYAVLLQVTPIVAIARSSSSCQEYPGGAHRMRHACRHLPDHLPTPRWPASAIRTDQTVPHEPGRTLQTLLRLRIRAHFLFLRGLTHFERACLIGAVVGEFVAGTGGRSSGSPMNPPKRIPARHPANVRALFLITVADVGLFVVMVGLSASRSANGTKAKSAPHGLIRRCIFAGCWAMPWLHINRACEE